MMLLIFIVLCSSEHSLTCYALPCSVLGGPEYMGVLMDMEKGSAALTGEVLFTDARLVANGFQIRLTPGKGPLLQF